MTYQQACEQLYEQRIAEKNAKEQRRNKFRQSVLDRQNKEAQYKKFIPETDIAEDTTYQFAMPETLPNDTDKLKWLIFQNIEMMQKHPEKTKEAKGNIKRIKAHTLTIA